MKPLEQPVLQQQVDLRYRLMVDYPLALPEWPFGIIRLHAGFLSDLHSVPIWVPRVIADDDDYPLAALFHDLLYRHRGFIGATDACWTSGRVCYTRLQADRLYRYLLSQSGAPAWQCWLMYAAVRLGGRARWRTRNTKP